MQIQGFIPLQMMDDGVRTKVLLFTFQANFQMHRVRQDMVAFTPKPLVGILFTSTFSHEKASSGTALLGFTYLVDPFMDISCQLR